jgi:hypothetical protein
VDLYDAHDAARPPKLTRPQQRALVGLLRLVESFQDDDRCSWPRERREQEKRLGWPERRGHPYYERRHIARVAGGGSYPVATMLALWRAGLVVPESEDALRLVLEKVCTCGCDRWTTTEAGAAHGRGLNVVYVGDGRGPV